MEEKLKFYKEKFIETHFFRPRWYSILFNPYFIIRYSLYQKITHFSQELKGHQKVLDIGCGLKPYEALFSLHEYIGIDLEGGYRNNKDKKAIVFFNGLNIPYANDSFEVALCTEVLEHTENPDQLVEESYRILKKGGLLYLSAPLVWNEHEIPYDFRRFTQYGLEKILKKNNFKLEYILPTTSTFSALAQLFCAFIFESIKIKNSLLKLFLTLFIFFPIQITALGLDKLIKNNWITLGYVVKAKKN